MKPGVHALTLALLAFAAVCRAQLSLPTLCESDLSRCRSCRAQRTPSVTAATPCKACEAAASAAADDVSCRPTSLPAAEMKALPGCEQADWSTMVSHATLHECQEFAAGEAPAPAPAAQPASPVALRARLA